MVEYHLNCKAKPRNILNTDYIKKIDRAKEKKSCILKR